MRGVRLLKGDETEWKTEGVAKQDGGIFLESFQDLRIRWNKR